MVNLLKLKDGTLVLQRDGKNLMCPFIAPRMIFGSIAGQPPQMDYSSCTNGCAHFVFFDAKGLGGNELELTCGNPRALHKNFEIIVEGSLNLVK